jgi:hypothetical protein
VPPDAPPKRSSIPGVLPSFTPANAADSEFPENNQECCGGDAHSEMLADDVSEVDSNPVKLGLL